MPTENDERYTSTFETFSTQGCLAKDNIDMYGTKTLSSGRTRPGTTMVGPHGIRRAGEHSSTLSVTSLSDEQWCYWILNVRQDTYPASI